MPRAAKDAKVEAPDDIETLRQWLRVRCRGLKRADSSACD